MLLSEISRADGAAATGGVFCVLLFGPLGDEFGRTVQVAMPAAATVADLRRQLAAVLGPGGEKVLSPAVKISVDQTIAAEGALVRPGQEVAVLPVFSGG